jgi:hypothetical protein
MAKFIETEHALINADRVAYARKRNDHVVIVMADPAGQILDLYPGNCTLEELWRDIVVDARDAVGAEDD